MLNQQRTCVFLSLKSYLPEHDTCISVFATSVLHTLKAKVFVFIDLCVVWEP